ncbi:hypothetical protein [Pedobacter alluvionis]|uniref:Uncharacterized protein n=2 Tax=Pedobacter TaxID=84567 RepID=A0A497Y3K9_9SPHI|nr:hypothetical protein [Pedobacter alluvionis]RLJ76656.1 hypothetical protein BCL90_1699 [Pedobacter alluvionis]TFB34067.1 hypothetical protein E3V97_08490 [Pedobacter alluvionis]
MEKSLNSKFKDFSTTVEMTITLLNDNPSNQSVTIIPYIHLNIKAYIMNSFEEYTLIIGAIAVLVEAVKYVKRNFRSWFEHT